jgi:hypothetical protein
VLDGADCWAEGLEGSQTTFQPVKHDLVTVRSIRVLLQTRHSPSAAILAIPAIGTLKRQAKRSRGSESIYPDALASLHRKVDGEDATAATAPTPVVLPARFAQPVRSDFGDPRDWDFEASSEA